MPGRSQYIRAMNDRISAANSILLEDETLFESTYSYGLEITDGECFYCGKLLISPHDFLNNTFFTKENLQWDHVTPSSLLGLFAPGNVVPSCNLCNSHKNDMDAHSYYIERWRSGLKTKYKNIEELEKILKKMNQKYNESNLVNFNLTPFDYPHRIQKDDSVIYNELHQFIIDKDIESIYGGSSEPSRVIPAIQRRYADDAEIWRQLWDTDSQAYEKSNLNTENSKGNVRSRLTYVLNFFDSNVDGTLLNIDKDTYEDFKEKCIESKPHAKRKYRSVFRVLELAEGFPEDLLEKTKV